MNGAILDQTNQYWGLVIDHYPKFYDNNTLAALAEATLDDEKRALWRQDALHTIEELCMLSDPNLDSVISGRVRRRITLEKLKLVNKLGLNMDEVDNFALSRLVAGCVVLLSSVKPSPFYYEYGYLCFRIMIISLNVCLLKYANRLDPNARSVEDELELSKDSPSSLWVASAGFLGMELTGSMKEIFGSLYVGPPSTWNITLLEKPKLGALLNILHTDQKNFTIALKGTRSLGLSGFMYVLWKFVETERASMNTDDYQKKLLDPYTRILNRYCLALPSFKHEHGATLLVCRRVDIPKSAYQDNEPIDREDSRNVIRAYIQYLKNVGWVHTPELLRLMVFITPLVTLGCEDLIPDVFKVTMRTVWRRFALPGRELHNPTKILLVILECTWMYLRRLKPSSHENQPEPWVINLLKSIIDSDLIEAIIRFALYEPMTTDECSKRNQVCLSPRTHRHEAMSHEDILKSLKRIARLSMDLMSCIPNETLVHRLRTSESLRYWRKYLVFFGSCDLLDPMHTNCVMHHISTFWMAKFCEYALGDGWEEELREMQTYGICSSPRCPFPFGAELITSKHGNSPYCGNRCHAIGSIYAWQGPNESSADESITGGGRRSLIDPVNPLEYVLQSDTYLQLCEDSDSESPCCSDSAHSGCARGVEVFVERV
ncbi:hypothetical protein ACGC1H_006832 [Rhizoctonia solani]